MKLFTRILTLLALSALPFSAPAAEVKSSQWPVLTSVIGSDAVLLLATGSNQTITVTNLFTARTLAGTTTFTGPIVNANIATGTLGGAITATGTIAGVLNLGSAGIITLPLASTGTALDLGVRTLHTITLATGTTTIAATGYTPGLRNDLLLTAGTAGAVLVWPAWVAMGTAAIHTILPASKSLWVETIATGTTAGSVFARPVPQP